MPLQVSIVTVFLFAGPHNWFEFRYFLMRLPVRFGRSRNFFVTAFAGVGCSNARLRFVAVYLQRSDFGPMKRGPSCIAGWNTLLLAWLGLLVWLRSKQKRAANWTWTIPVGLALCSLNWLGPDFFSLALVYIHPLIALWFLDRHLGRTRPAWWRAVSSLSVPVAVCACRDDLAVVANRVTAGQLTVSSGASRSIPARNCCRRFRVTCWCRCICFSRCFTTLSGSSRLPLIGRTFVEDSFRSRVTRRGFPRVIAGLMIAALAAVVVLWFGFSIDYSTTRDIYFTVAIAHVLAEAPFLLRML